MKNVPSTGLTISPLRFAATIRFFSFLLLLSSAAVSRAQAITEIITDYKGYWKSSAAAPNAVKPDNAHNLLAFSYNGKRYSTGVNDNLLLAKGDNFILGDFWSLPVSNLTGTITSNTKVGLGALYDGVLNGASNPVPEWGINTYLTDGSKGLGLGTCIANLPVGSMSFAIEKIKPTAIGDGIPDILVTQVADPTGNSYDRYEFTDADGNRVGNYKDIVFTNITPVGTWTADFYEAIQKPLVLTAGFTQTDRPIRLWAADLSELGITAANYEQVKSFRINLCGNSDVAFAGYNSGSIGFRLVLPVQYTSFTATLLAGKTKLAWETVSEKDADRYVVERSADGRSFAAIDSLKASNLSSANSYTFTDRATAAGRVYYRLRQVDVNGGFTYSKTVSVEAGEAAVPALRIYPNPASGAVSALHTAAPAGSRLVVRNISGMVVKQQALATGVERTSVGLDGLSAGAYFLCLEDGVQKTTTAFVVR